MQCTAKAVSTGVQCRAKAIAGGRVCLRHGGMAPQTRSKAAVRAEVEKWVLGDPVDDPGEVMLRLVTQSRMRADRYAEELASKLEAEGVSLEDVLVGKAYAVNGDGKKVQTGEYIRGLAKLEAEERDRLGQFASKAVAAGLAERQVRVAERQGAMLLAVLSAVLNDPRLGLSDAQRKAAPDVIRRELGRLQ